ncbi:MAG: hypothetical protein GX640_18455 [Fibrobacter sp.]|nr:hypothetical protein [Fibrobacter sp.]
MCFCGNSQDYKIYRDSIFSALKRQNYLSANAHLDAALQIYPDNMELWYLGFAIEQTRILDYESYFIEGSNFISESKNLKKKFEIKLKSLKDTDEVFCRFYLANILGGMSIIQAKTNDWVDAAKNSRQAVAELKNLVKSNPDFSAAYLGIGMFDYYMNKGIKKFIPFVQDKSLEAIKTLQKALSADYPFNDAAKSSLCWVLIDYGNFRKADSIAKATLQAYPNHSAFIRIRAYIALWSNNYTLANELGCAMVQNAESRSPLNWSDLVSGTYIMVYSSTNTGNIEDALAACDNLLRRDIPKEFKEIPSLNKNLKYILETHEKYSGNKRK